VPLFRRMLTANDNTIGNKQVQVAVPVHKSPPPSHEARTYGHICMPLNVPLPSLRRTLTVLLLVLAAKVVQVPVAVHVPTATLC
jgi:hypothetical protein